MKHKVFVYGTLRRGLGNHGYLANSRLVGEATINGYEMFDYGYFPAVVKGNGVIHGEIYEISDKTLKQLDTLEGHPKFYLRMEEKTWAGQFVWLYTMQASKVEGMTRVTSGDWLEHRRTRPESTVFH